MSRRIRDEFADMIGCTELCETPPKFEFHDSLHGSGGLFDGEQWAILIGVDDMGQIGEDVSQRWPERLAELYASGHGGRRATSVQLLKYAIKAVTHRCIAHEIGHALIYAGHGHPYGHDEEAGADYFAGRLDGARGRSRALGELFFFSIGCEGPSCDHPSPEVRADAYITGYDEQRHAA